MAATTVPSSPLELSHVSYDKCVASLQSRLGPMQADDDLDLEHNWTSMHMNNNNDVPITGHTYERFRDAQRTNCKNSRPRQALGRVQAPKQDMIAPAHASLPQEMHAPQSLPGACITCTP